MKQHSHGPYFEGWYMKFQTNDGSGIALIPALHIDAAGRRSASLQLITGSNSWWLKYPDIEFGACGEPLDIRIGRSRFSVQGTSLNIDRPGCSLSGSLRFGNFAPLSSDIMGPFRFIPGMECSHGVISMGHRLEGSLNLNGKVLDFSGGIGYAETDRGRSFPDAYLWTQCVRRGERLSSLMLSVATIPLAWLKFTGCICAICCEGREYRLATYLGARVEMWSQHGAVIRQGKYCLEVDVPEADSQPLRAPVAGAMQRIVHESLCTKVSYRFWIDSRLVFEHMDDCASFEYAQNAV